MKRMVYSAGSSPMRFQLPGQRRRRTGAAPNAASRRRCKSARPRPSRDQSAQRHVELRAEDDAAAERQRDAGHLHDVGSAGDGRPHDTRIAADGTIWFNHFNDNAIGRLDPKTGETKEWRWPYRAKEGSFAADRRAHADGPGQEGPLVHRQPGAERRRRLRSGDRAVRVSRSAGRRRDDRRLRCARRRQRMARVAGPVAGGGVYQIDLETWESRRDQRTNRNRCTRYDIAADTRTTCTAAAAAAPYVWRVDAKTLEVQYYDIPAEPRGVGGVRPRHAARQHGLAGSALVGRLRRQLHRHARSDASPRASR